MPKQVFSETLRDGGRTSAASGRHRDRRGDPCKREHTYPHNADEKELPSEGTWVRVRGVEGER